jgi:hypothetical protein
MANINWRGSDPLFLNPKFGSNLQGTALKGVPVPIYDNYGGPGISGPELPVDALDALFQQHDFDIFQKTIDDNVVMPEELVQPHATLINAIKTLPKSGGLILDNAEATLYAGFTIFALTAQLAQFRLLDDLEVALDPTDILDPFVFDNVSAALNDARECMETGFAELTPGEAGEARSLHGLLPLFETQFDDFLIA